MGLRTCSGWTCVDGLIRVKEDKGEVCVNIHTTHDDYKYLHNAGVRNEGTGACMNMDMHTYTDRHTYTFVSYVPHVNNTASPG